MSKTLRGAESVLGVLLIAVVALVGGGCGGSSSGGSASGADARTMTGTWETSIDEGALPNGNHILLSIELTLSEASDRSINGVASISDPAGHGSMTVAGHRSGTKVDLTMTSIEAFGSLDIGILTYSGTFADENTVVGSGTLGFAGEPTTPVDLTLTRSLD